VDSTGHIYVSDSGNGFIDEFNAGGATPIVNQINISVAEPGGFITGIALDGTGNIYAADQNNSVVEIFAPSTSNLLSVFGQGGVTSSEALSYLTGVAMGGGNAWTSDFQNGSGSGSIEQWGPVY
jgi:DNA-binding beta-propeller fold protein YncE